MLKLKVGATAVFQTLLILIFIVFVSSPATAIAAAVGDGDALFLVSTKKTPVQSLEPTSERARLVEINFAALAQAETLTLNFFEDAVFTAVKDRIERNQSGSYTWIGFFETAAGPGQAILVVRDDIVVGHINAPDGEYVVRPALGKTHLVLEVGETAVLGTNHYDILPGLSLPKPTTGIPTMAPTTADDGSVIDVLVLYTDDAVAAQGVPTLESLIDLYMAYTNQAYINSNITQRVDLVYTGEISYTEPGNTSTPLGHLRNTGDGQLEDVHTLRNTYHADLNYLLIQNDGSPSSCGGIAYVQSSVTASWQNNGFSVQEACSYGSGVFAHELGHNMGSNHDWYVDSPTTNPYSYAHGYTNTNPANAFRTIMSYGNHCSALGLSCTAIPNFSNPNVTYNGEPTGVAEGTSTACTQNNASNPLCDADNRKTFNNTDSNTAGFRKSEITWLGNSTDWNSASNWRIYEGVYNALSPVNRVPRSIDDVFIPSSPTGGNFPTISSGTVNARNVTLATGATLNMSGGTFNVYGMWEEQGTGTFNGSGGTVIFQGRLLPQMVTATASSTFPNVQVGNGGSTTINLGSNVDINGNVLIKSGATFNASSYMVEVSGNWEDEGNGFAAGTSTVILDGVDQTLDKVTTQAVFSENFNQYTNCCTSGLPSGWDSEAIDGDIFYQGPRGGNSPSANRWEDTTDAWLHSLAVSLQPNVTYQLSYKQRSGSSSSQQDWNVYLGATQSAAGMTTLVDSANNVNNTTFVTETGGFTVATSGIYYLGFHATRDTGSSYGSLDDISLTAVQNLTFYNLTIANSGTATFNQSATVLNNLVVNSGATADFGSNNTTAEGSVTNNGTMQQSRNISDGSGTTTYEFLTLKNGAGDTTKYYGVAIKPDGGQALGQTAVSISGNQSCTSNSGDPLLRRCYNITPTTAQSATIKYWYTNAELNGQTWNNLKLWDWHSSAWTELAAGNDSYGAGCGSDAGCWGQWTGVATFSPMVLGSSTAPAGSPAGTCSAPTAPTTMSMNTAGTQLTWSGGTADSYQVWRATNTPYFTPGANCASPGALACTANATSPLTISASTVGTNYYYKIVAVNTCGSTVTATGHKGAFSFGITPGTP